MYYVIKTHQKSKDIMILMHSDDRPIGKTQSFILSYSTHGSEGPPEGYGRKTTLALLKKNDQALPRLSRGPLKGMVGIRHWRTLKKERPGSSPLIQGPREGYGRKTTLANSQERKALPSRPHT